MKTRYLLRSFPLLPAFLLTFGTAEAQHTPWHYWTLADPAVMDEIIGEASGETAFNTIMETGGYNKNRLADEYGSGTFYESQFIYDKLLEYGLPGAELVRFPGGEVWDGIKGELWEVTPLRQKLASYKDMTAMLANGSQNADVTAPLVWVGRGSPEELDRAGVAGKIVVTEGSISGVHQAACVERGALGVVSIANGRPNFDPIQIPWSGIRGRGAAGETKFGFFIPPREAEVLKHRLLAGEEITVHAQVETTTYAVRPPGPGGLHPRHRSERRRDHSLGAPLRGIREAGGRRQQVGERRNPGGGPDPPHPHRRGANSPSEAHHPVPLGTRVFRHRSLGQREQGPHGERPWPTSTWTWSVSGSR